MTRVVSAYNARKNLGEILNAVYYRGEEIIIERKGRPLVKISKISEKPNSSAFLSFAGKLSANDARIMLKVFEKNRKTLVRKTLKV